MSREEDLNILYSTPPQEPNMRVFDSIMPPCPLLALISYPAIVELNRIAKDKQLSAKPKEKLQMIKDIMGQFGFRKLASGTNRIVFKYLENQDIVVKVAYDATGLSDNLNEMYNQQFIKPFCCKVFEVSPCGTVGMFERVHLINSRAEFATIADEVYDIIINHLVGRYILDDFGTKYFMNWGVRENMHPVILDFPYCYELDGAKIYCNRPSQFDRRLPCGGEIDYDDGFNHLYCKKCGKSYLASELRLAIEKKSKEIFIDKEENDMIVSVVQGDKVLTTNDSSKDSRTYRRFKNGKVKETPYEYRKRKGTELRVSVQIPDMKKSEEVTRETPEGTSIGTSEGYDNSQFNQGWASQDVPSVDPMYKDLKTSIISGTTKEAATITNGKADFTKERKFLKGQRIEDENGSTEDTIVYGNPAVPETYEEKANKQEEKPAEEQNVQEESFGQSIAEVMHETNVELQKEQEEVESTQPDQEQQEEKPSDNQESDYMKEHYPNATELVNINLDEPETNIYRPDEECPDEDQEPDFYPDEF